jgi:hypothetical protein
LVDVPVLVKNFNDTKGNQPNANGLDENSSRLVRRFFISETISGIQTSGGYFANAAPQVIRYAKSVKLRVEMNSAANEKIFKPMLEISYEEMPVSMISSETQTQLQFQVDYFQSASRYLRTIQGIFIAANILVGLIVAVRMYYFIQHNPPRVLGQKFPRHFAFRLV